MTRRLTYGEECCLRHWSRAQACMIPGELLRAALAELDELRKRHEGCAGLLAEYDAAMKKLSALQLDVANGLIEAEQRGRRLERADIVRKARQVAVIARAFCARHGGNGDTMADALDDFAGDVEADIA